MSTGCPGASPAATAASGGRRVGLGLALVTQIVRSHGGRLEVTETPGGGATFSLLIPSAAD